MTKDRSKFLGGSDAAAAVGLSCWQPAYELWLEKTGQLVPKEERPQEVAERMEWGNEMEEAIGRVYSRRTGYQIRRRAQETGVAHKQHPFLVAHVDYVIIGQRRGMDCKNVGGIYYAQSDEWGEGGTDQVPTEIYLQAQHYLAVLEYDFWDIAALVGGNSLKIFTVPRDDGVIHDLVEGECEFWEMVQAKTPPPLDYDHPKTVELLQRQHRDVKPVTVDAPPSLLPWCDVFEQAKERIKTEQAVAEGAKARILEVIGTAGALAMPNGARYTRKLVQKKAYTVEAQEYVELRRRQPE
jgi:putative phage-type endonuclease